MSNIEEKIKKLHAMMVDSGASPNEREVAQKLIAKLCEEHFLQLDVILKNGRDHTITEKSSFTRWKEYNNAYYNIGWAISHGLGDVIAIGSKDIDGNFCMKWFGQTTSIEEADYMFTYLIRAISKVRKFPGLRNDAQKLEDGFAFAIKQRMDEIAEHTRTHFQQNNSTALMVINDHIKEINKFIRQTHPYTTAGHSVGVNNWNVGYEMGRKIGLNKGVTGGVRKQLK